MQTKTLEVLLEIANKEIKRLDFTESLNLIKKTESVIIDVREESEVLNQGLIKDAIHIPRGLIEFKLSPNSINNPANINADTNLLIYCAGGYRSALAAKTLLDLGFKNVFNLGGYQEWIDSGGEIQASP
jgi:rhodanese-related sulfurtransferase